MDRTKSSIHDAVVAPSLLKPELTLYTRHNEMEARNRCCRRRHDFRDGGSADIRSLRHPRHEAVWDRSRIPADDAQFYADFVFRHRSIGSPLVQLLHIVVRTASSWASGIIA